MGGRKPITYQGQEFSSLTSLAQHLGMSENALYRLRKKGVPEDEWTDPRHRKQGAKGKEIVYKGDKFSSVLELAEHLGIERDTLAARIRAGWPEEKWSLSNQKPRLKDILYKGRVFKNITELSSHLEIDRALLKERIETGWPKSRWGDPNQKRRNLEYDGHSFDSYRKLAVYLVDNNKTEKLSYMKILAALKKYSEDGMALNDAVEMACEDQKKVAVNYLGAKYESVSDLARYLDLTPKLLLKRIRSSWPEEMWAAKRLPKGTPDFYYCINKPEILIRPCNFYVVEMRRFPEYQKAGIAVSLEQRRDAEYGEANYLREFENRLDALIFEGAVLSATKKYKEAPSELEELDWAGITEVRKVNWPELEEIIVSIEELLDEAGMEQVALTHIPMSKNQRKSLGKALEYLEASGGRAPSAAP